LQGATGKQRKAPCKQGRDARKDFIKRFFETLKRFSRCFFFIAKTIVFSRFFLFILHISEAILVGYIVAKIT